MRRTLILIGMILSSGQLLATNGDRERRPAAPPLAKSEAENYGQQLLATIREIQANYVRPVTSAELVRAALSGLYEAAHLPVSDSLAADLARATTEAELMALPVRIRAGLGDLEPLHGSNALLASLRAMTARLDPYSGIITGTELLRANLEASERGGGFELESNAGIGPARVKSVALGGPAQRAGVRPGDQITHIDGEAMDSPESAEALQHLLNTRPARTFDPADGVKRFELALLRARQPTPVTVTIASGPFKTETVLGVNRAADNNWNYYLDRKQKIAHVRIATLGRRTPVDLCQVLSQLDAEGVRGLILDLRWCPGGLLAEAVTTAGLFLRDRPIATVVNRDQQGTEFVPARGLGVFDFPLVVLVNGDTSGGAELIAAALQDHRRAIVVGQRTLGKGSVQTPLPLPIANAGLKLTTGSLVRPSGKGLHRFPDSKAADDWGVRPDPGQEFPISPDLSTQLRDWWLLQSLRPGSSREVLPLDDPDNDPQRRAAVRALLEQCQDES